MLLRLVTEKKEVKCCQEKLEKQLKRVLKNREKLKIGFHGGDINNDIFYDDTLWYSTLPLEENVKVAKYWNAFGLGKRSDGNQIIIVEINPPFEGAEKQVAGLFARDEQTKTYFLLHRGKIGGGRKGIGKDAFKNWYRGKWSEVVDDKGNQEEAILISSVTSNKLKNNIRGFVQEVAKFKDEVTNKINSRSDENIETAFSFAREYFGTKRGKRKSKFEYESNHGLIVNALDEFIKISIPSNHKTFNNAFVDLGVFDGKKINKIFEVKTTADKQSIYTGIGQLMFHSKGDSEIEKILIIPKDEYDTIVYSILHKLKIKIMTFSIEDDEIIFKA